MNMIKRPVLQLNAAYEPTRIITVKRALTLLTKGKAVVELATEREIYPGIYLPSVIRILTYRHVPLRMQIVTRKNIHIRDGYRCGYCGEAFPGSELTLDHIMPKSRGGKESWDNLISACKRDNHRKADRNPEEAGMALLFRPLPSTVHTARFLLRSMASETKAWSKYLYHDNNGDRRFTAVG